MKKLGPVLIFAFAVYLAYMNRHRMKVLDDFFVMLGATPSFIGEPIPTTVPATGPGAFGTDAQANRERLAELEAEYTRRYNQTMGRAPAQRAPARGLSPYVSDEERRAMGRYQQVWLVGPRTTTRGWLNLADAAEVRRRRAEIWGEGAQYGSK